MVAMLNPHSTLMILSCCSLVLGAAACAARREYLRRCRDRRITQMARIAVLSFEGVPARNQTENLAWQAWEASTGGRGC